MKSCHQLREKTTIYRTYYRWWTICANSMLYAFMLCHVFETKIDSHSVTGTQIPWIWRFKCPWVCVCSLDACPSLSCSPEHHLSHSVQLHKGSPSHTRWFLLKDYYSVFKQLHYASDTEINSWSFLTGLDTVCIEYPSSYTYKSRIDSEDKMCLHPAWVSLCNTISLRAVTFKAPDNTYIVYPSILLAPS